MSDSDIFDVIGKGIIYAIIGGVLLKGLQFGFRFSLAKVLGAEQYGLFILGWTVASFGLTFSLLGINRGVIRFISQYREEDQNQEHIRWIMVFSITFVGVTSFVLAVSLFIISEPLSKLFNTTNQTIFSLFSILIPFWALTQLIGAILKSYNKIKMYEIVKTSRLTIPLLFPLLFSVMDFSFDQIIVSSVIGGGISLLISGYILFKRCPISLRGPKGNRDLDILYVSFPLFLTGVSYMLLTQIDKIFLGHFTSSSIVGIYDTAYLIASQLPLLFTAATTVYEPIISEYYYNEKLEELQSALQSIARLLSLSIGPVGSVMVITAPQLYSLLGSSFTGGITILLILSIHHIIHTTLGPTGEILQMSGKEKLSLINIIICVVINLVLNFLLIPVYGGIGAAIATTSSLIFLEIIIVIELYYLIGIHPFSHRQIPIFVMSIILIAISMLFYVTSATQFDIIILSIFASSIVMVINVKYFLEQNDKRIIARSLPDFKL